MRHSRSSTLIPPTKSSKEGIVNSSNLRLWIKGLWVLATKTATKRKCMISILINSEALCLLLYQTSPHEDDHTSQSWHRTPEEGGNTWWEGPGLGGSTDLLGCSSPRDMSQSKVTMCNSKQAAVS